jgi:hypothetical protein
VWATRDDMEDLYRDVVAIWRAWAEEVSGAPIESGHHIAEEAPGPFAEQIAAFIAGPTGPGRAAGRRKVEPLAVTPLTGDVPAPPVRRSEWF